VQVVRVLYVQFPVAISSMLNMEELFLRENINKFHTKIKEWYKLHEKVCSVLFVTLHIFTVQYRQIIDKEHIF
jgi:hypothetical protein